MWSQWLLWKSQVQYTGRCINEDQQVKTILAENEQINLLPLSSFEAPTYRYFGGVPGTGTVLPGAPISAPCMSTSMESADAYFCSLYEHQYVVRGRHASTFD